jgi:hypothetical protein
MIEGWYITATAVREFQAICGLTPVDDGEQFDRCAVELEKACETATLKKTEPHRRIYATKVTSRGLRERIEITVSLAEREEGDAWQVVRVRRKGGGHTKRGRSQA